MASNVMWPSDGSLVVGTHGSGHKSRLVFGRKLLRYFARQLGSGQVDLAHAVGQIELAEDCARSAEGIGFDDVAAHCEKIGVHVANDVGTAEDENFAAVFLAPIIVERGLRS